jgi:hypothetical protein
MLPTDGKPTNGFENEIRWSFLNPLGNSFFEAAPRGFSFWLIPVLLLISIWT